MASKKAKKASKKAKAKVSSKIEAKKPKSDSDKNLKDCVLSLRINGSDLAALQAKAEKKGKKYQTFIGEILSREAQKA